VIARGVAGSRPAATEIEAGTKPAGPSPATLLYAAAALASAGLLIYWTSKQSFLYDEWSFILDRRGFSADVFLDPHNDHIVVIPVAIYKILLAVFGLDSPAPFQVTAVAIFIGSVTVVFFTLRRMIGEWLALACALPLLVFGSGFESLLMPFQLSFSLSLGLGVAAFGARRDLTACLLLVLSVLSVSLGVAFALGYGAWLLVTPGGLRRIWVALVPLGVYGLWWLGWGHTAESAVTAESIASTPSYVLDGLSSSLASLLGLTVERTDLDLGSLDWGRPLLVLAAVIVIWRAWRLRADRGNAPVLRLLLGVAVLAVAFWALAGFNSVGGLRPATAARYQFAGAVFVLLIAAVACGRVRLSREALAVAFAVALVSAGANLYTLHSEWKSLVDQSRQQRASLTGLQLERDRVSPSYELRSADTGLAFAEIIQAGPYFSAVDKYGSPAYSLGDLVSAPEAARESADRVAANAAGIELVPASQAPGPCTTTELGPTPVSGDIPAGGVSFVRRQGGSADLALGRFADGYPVDLGPLPNGASTLQIPADAATEPWRFQLDGDGAIEVCAASG
jgi:hypothetical protein